MLYILNNTACKKYVSYLLRRRGERSDELGHDGFDLGVVFIQMFGQRAHENNHTLTDRIIAGVLGGVL